MKIHKRYRSSWLSSKYSCGTAVSQWLLQHVCLHVRRSGCFSCFGAETMAAQHAVAMPPNTTSYITLALGRSDVCVGVRASL